MTKETTDNPGENYITHLETLLKLTDEWTTDPPTQIGLYRAVAEYNGLAYWVELTDLADIRIFSVYFFGNDVSYSVSDFTYWLGPLPIPEPPKASE